MAGSAQLCFPPVPGLVYDGLMRLVFAIGVMLLATAFVGGLAEIAAGATLDKGRWWLDTYETWLILGPESFQAFRNAVVEVSPTLWNPFVMALLKLPPWFLFGLPGGLLAWIARPHRQEEGEGPDEESLFFYDELAQRAREEGFDDEGEWLLHNHLGLETHDDNPDLDTSHDDMAPREHDGIDKAAFDIDLKEDDRAPTEHGYNHPDINGDEAWGNGEEAGAEEPGRASPPARSRPIPEPPRTGEGHWIAAPPAAESGRDKE